MNEQQIPGENTYHRSELERLQDIMFQCRNSAIEAMVEFPTSVGERVAHLEAALEKAEARANVLDDHYKFQEQHRLEAVTKLEAANCKIEEMRQALECARDAMFSDYAMPKKGMEKACDVVLEALSNLPSSVKGTP